MHTECAYGADSDRPDRFVESINRLAAQVSIERSEALTHDRLLVWCRPDTTNWLRNQSC